MVARPALLALLLAGGCAADSGPDAGRGDPERCVALFQTYDAINASMSTPSGKRDRMPIPSALQRPVGDLQQAGCLTLSDELDLAVAGAPVTDGGAAIDPVGLHAGVVTSMEDEAAARAFFSERGVPARSIGAPGLGRRIYLGPFATEGALDGDRAGPRGRLRFALPRRLLMRRLGLALLLAGRRGMCRGAAAAPTRRPARCCSSAMTRRRGSIR